MNAADKPLARPPARSLLVPLAVVAVVAGIAIGWFMRPSYDGIMFRYVYAVLHPAFFAAFSIAALRRDAKVARWLVALMLAALLLDIAQGSHAPVLSAVAVASGALALVATLLRKRRLAIVTTALCGASFAATLVAGLLLR